MKRWEDLSKDFPTTPDNGYLQEVDRVTALVMEELVAAVILAREWQDEGGGEG